MNSFYRLRIDAAVRLFQGGKAKYFLVSGDNGRVGYDEPAAMKRDLIANGIPGDRIYRDMAGFRTLDSMVRAKEVFGQDKFIVISQRYHVERAVFLAHHKGINALGYSAELPDNGDLRWHHRVRETFARLAAGLDIFVFGTQPTFLGPKIFIGRDPAN